MQSIAAQLGNGEAVSAAYVARRKAIEAKHAPNDDGTEIHYERQHGDRREYANDLPDPITDDSPVVALCDCGLNAHDLNQLEKHDVTTVADVRQVLADGAIPTWPMCGDVMERHVRQAVERVGR